MTHYEYWWRRYGIFLAVNLVVISGLAQLITRGAWTLLGFLVLALVMADLFFGRILKERNDTSKQGAAISTRGGFFRFYGYALVVGGLIWLLFRFKQGITWVDFVPFVIFILLAVAMLSISRKTDR